MTAATEHEVQPAPTCTAWPVEAVDLGAYFEALHSSNILLALAAALERPADADGPEEHSRLETILRCAAAENRRLVNEVEEQHLNPGPEEPATEMFLHRIEAALAAVNALAVMAQGEHNLTEQNPALLPACEYVSTIIGIAHDVHDYVLAVGRAHDLLGEPEA